MDATSFAAVVGALGAGLMAGMFFAFSSFVMRALDEVDASPRVLAMQQINQKILNPLFVVIFAGTGLVSVYLIIVGVDDSAAADRAARLGAVLYLLGVIIVTMTQNVPLNNRLDRVDAEADDAPTMWEWYRGRWMRWNHLRTVAAIGATVCFCLAVGL